MDSSIGLGLHLLIYGSFVRCFVLVVSLFLIWEFDGSFLVKFLASDVTDANGSLVGLEIAPYY